MVFLLLALFCQSFWAQNQLKTEEISFKRNEVKLNALGLVFGGFELTYERLLNKRSSLGLSYTTPFQENDLNFAGTLYYRCHFGKKPAQGFFLDAFAMYYGYDKESNGLIRKKTDTAIGIGLGSKWVISKKIPVEFFCRFGKNMGGSVHNTGPTFVFITGVNVGYRF